MSPTVKCWVRVHAVEETVDIGGEGVHLYTIGCTALMELESLPRFPEVFWRDYQGTSLAKDHVFGLDEG